MYLRRYTVDNFRLIPSCSQTLCQSLYIKCGPRSEIAVMRDPWRHHTCLMNSLACSCLLSSSLQGVWYLIFGSLSATISIVLHPFDQSSHITNLIDMSSHLLWVLVGVSEHQMGHVVLSEFFCTYDNILPTYSIWFTITRVISYVKFPRGFVVNLTMVRLVKLQRSVRIKVHPSPSGRQ